MPPVSFKTFVQGSTAASTPLGGTEQIVIIQGNAVVQCVADDLGSGGGGATTVISKTVAEMQALATGAGFTAGQLYKITDAGDLGLFFRAATTSKLENDGIRVMLCPAYYGTGENAGDGNNWLGVWNANLPAETDCLVIWGGLVWRNLTNEVGSADSDTALDGTNWEVVAKASFAAAEYIPLIFGCSYDLTNNWISKQWDGKGNIFGMDYFVEQEWWVFGFNTCDISDWNRSTDGRAFFGNRCLGVWNNSNAGEIIGNIISDGSIARNTNNGYIYGNVCGSDITQNANGAGIANNIFPGGILGNTNGGGIYNNYGSGESGGVFSLGGTSAYSNNELPKAVFSNNGDFALSGYSNGTTFTDTGSGGTVRCDFEDGYPTGTEFHFFVTDNGIELNPGAVGHTIQFWDGSVSRNTPLVLLGAPGKSITIRKISTTVWAGIAVNGAVDND